MSADSSRRATVMTPPIAQLTATPSTQPNSALVKRLAHTGAWLDAADQTPPSTWRTIDAGDSLLVVFSRGFSQSAYTVRVPSPTRRSGGDTLTGRVTEWFDDGNVHGPSVPARAIRRPCPGSGLL